MSTGSVLFIPPNAEPPGQSQWGSHGAGLVLTVQVRRQATCQGSVGLGVGILPSPLLTASSYPVPGKEFTWPGTNPPLELALVLRSQQGLHSAL